MVGDATITSDLESRRLIVVTDDETNENIKTIIASLDKPKPQVLINVRFSGELDPLEHPSVKEACARVTERMAGRGRVLLRKSGTEPLLRVMVEGDDEAAVRSYADELAKIVAEVCA
jgi:phosphomannomutase